MMTGISIKSFSEAMPQAQKALESVEATGIATVSGKMKVTLPYKQLSDWMGKIHVLYHENGKNRGDIKFLNRCEKPFLYLHMILKVIDLSGSMKEIFPREKFRMETVRGHFRNLLFQYAQKNLVSGKKEIQYNFRSESDQRDDIFSWFIESAKTEESFSKRVELGKICAAIRGCRFFKDCSDFRISSETDEGFDAWIEIFKSIAKRGETCLLEKEFGKLGITGTTAERRSKIFELLEEGDFELSSYDVKELGFDLHEPDAQELLWILAQKIIESNLFNAKHIRDFGIDPETEIGQARLIAIAKKIGAAQDIDKFKIKSKKALIEIAMCALNTSHDELALNIQSFEFDPAIPEEFNALVTLAKGLAEKSVSALFRHIYRFGLDHEIPFHKKALREIFIYSIKNADKGCTLSFSILLNFGLDIQNPSDEELIYQFAIRYVEGPQPDIYGLRKFGISSRRLVEILKHGIKHAEVTSKRVWPADEWGVVGQLYGLWEEVPVYNGIADLGEITCHGFDQEDVVALARCAAMNPKLDVAQFIKSLEIESTDAIRSIGLLAAHHQTKVAMEKHENFTKLLPEEEVLPFTIELFKVAASSRPCAVTEALKNLTIPLNQSTRFEIARCSAQKDGAITMRDFNDFRLKTETLLERERVVEIVTLSIRQNPTAAYWINKREFNEWGECGRRILMDFAKMLLAIPGGYRNCGRIKQFHLDPDTEEGQEMLCKIARVQAKTKTKFYREEIRAYGIKSEQTRFEIAKLSFTPSVFEEDYPFECDLSYSYLRKLLPVTLFKELDLFKKIGGVTEFLRKTKGSRDKEPFIKLLKQFYKAQNKQRSFDQCQSHAEKLLEMVPKTYQEPVQGWIDDALKMYKNKKKTEEVQEAKLIWIMEVILTFAMNDFPELEPLQVKLLNEVLSVHDRALRNRLTIAMFELFETPQAVRLYSEMLQKEPRGSLLCLVLKGSEGYLDTANRLVFTFYGNMRLRKNPVILRSLMNLLLDLETTSYLSKKEQFQLIHAMTLKEGKMQYPEFCGAVMNFENLLQCEQYDLLRKVRSVDDLRFQFREYMLELLEFPNPESFPSDLTQAFRGFRSFTLLGTYASRINSLEIGERLRAKEAFRGFVNAVLEGTFHKIRYDLEKSSHLKKVFSNFPDLQNEWRKGERLTIDQLSDLGEKGPANKNDIHKQFKESILVHYHLGVKNPALVGYLEGKITIEAALEKAEEGGVEHACLQFLQKGSNNILAHLKDLKVRIPNQFELKNDIIAWIAQLTQGKTSLGKKARWEVWDTDAPDDLFLFGEEVNGSCQRVSGRADLNKCVLSLLNPEIRLLAIKDHKGTILARSVFRLLWNKKEKKPALFMERIYYRSHDPEIDQLLIEMGKRRARKLGLPLMSQKYGKKCEEVTLSCSGGPAPWVYVDSAGGIKDSSYSINADKKIAL